MFDDWQEDKNDGGSAFRRMEKLRAAQVPSDLFEGEDAAVAAAIIDAAGNHFDRDFYATWNGHATVRLHRGGGSGTLAVLSMARQDDEYGPQDTPTFAWKTEGDATWLVGSTRFRDKAPGEALGLEWPAKPEFTALSGVQGWGE